MRSSTHFTNNRSIADSDRHISIDWIDRFLKDFVRSSLSPFLLDKTPSARDEQRDKNEVLAGHLSTAIDIGAQIAK
jgi:hypothetical protein